MSYQPTNLESRRIMTETIKSLIEPIQNRLNAVTYIESILHRSAD